jgi:hypothetical protein
VTQLGIPVLSILDSFIYLEVHWRNLQQKCQKINLSALNSTPHKIMHIHNFQY